MTAILTNTGQLKSSREGSISWMTLSEMRSGDLAPNMERYLDVFCDEHVLQTHGEANCWDDVMVFSDRQ